MPQKPIPTALKVLNGNPGHRPLNFDEPKPRQRKPKAPAHLGPAALAEWKRVLGVLWHMGHVTEAEADVLAVYVQAYARWVTASRLVESEGLIMRYGALPPMRHPGLKIVDDCLRTMLRCMGELGMTPSARTRLTAPGPDDDPFEAFLRGG